MVLVGKAAARQDCSAFSSKGFQLGCNGVFLLFLGDFGAGWGLVEKSVFLLKCFNAEMKAVTKQNVFRARR